MGSKEKGVVFFRTKAFGLFPNTYLCTIKTRKQYQVKVARGRTDLVVFMRDAVYVMELKMRGTAQEALEQIDSKDYAIPYEAEGKPVIKIGMAFSQETRTVAEWKIVR